MMRLVLVRHGATENNIEQRYTGQLDVPLNALGQRQAWALASALADERFDALLASDLRRARQTAEAIGRQRDRAIELDADLREFDMGEWQGRTYAEIVAASPTALASWQHSPDTAPPPGGETVLAVRDRAARVVARCLAAYPDGRVLCVTHGGVIGVLLCHLLEIELRQRWRFRRDNAAITELDIGPDYAILMRLNETCHLRDLPAGEPNQVL
jgi:alpha-ribazole phosphatase